MVDENAGNAMVDQWYRTTRMGIAPDSVIGFDDAEWTQLELNITTALHQREKETWGKVAKTFDEKFHATDKRLDNTRDYRVDEFYAYCMKQAEEAPMSEPHQGLTRYWVDMHGNFLEMFPGVEAKPKLVYLAADVDARLAQLHAELEAVTRENAAWKLHHDANDQALGLTGMESRSQASFIADLTQQLADANARVDELEGDFMIVHEQKLAMTQQLAAMTQERDKWQRWATHRVPTHGPCCTCQRCGLDHEQCRCDLDDVCHELDALTQQLAAMTRDRDEIRLKARAKADLVMHLSTTLGIEEQRAMNLTRQLTALQNELCTAKDQIPPDMDDDSLSVVLIKLKDESQQLAAREAVLARLSRICSCGGKIDFGTDGSITAAFDSHKDDCVRFIARQALTKAGA